MQTPPDLPQNLLARRVGLKFDSVQALKSLGEIRQKFELSSARRQLNLTRRDSITTSTYDGTGSLFDPKSKIWLAREGDFKSFGDEFVSSYFHEIYLELAALLKKENKNLGRARLMFMPPKSCYSMHHDPTARYHLPIVTNHHALLVFLSGQIFHLPATGDIYYVDTRQTHTAMNGGETDRIHLVFSEAEQSE